MKPDDKLKFFEKIDEYYSIDEDKFNKMVKYFKKIGYKMSTIKFILIPHLC